MADGMEVVKPQLEEIKKQYEGREIAECFAQLHMNFSCEVQNIAQKISSIDTRVVQLEKFADHASDTLTDINERMKKVDGKIKEEITQEARERLKLEIWGRKWNLVIRGIPGKLNEMPRITEVKVRELFENKLGLTKQQVSAILFTAVHRLPGGHDENNKNIMVRFSSLIDRDGILQQGMRQKPGSGFSIIPVVPPSVGLLRSKLLREKRDMDETERRKTKFVYTKEYPFVQLVKKR